MSKWYASSKVILNEVEKHSDVFEIPLQVLGDSRLTDNKVSVANCRNTIIIMTTNIGSHLIQERFKDINPYNEDEVVEETKNEIMEQLRKRVRPEFLNRIDEVIMFRPLDKSVIRQIVSIRFRLIQQHLEENGLKLEASDDVLD